MAMGRRTRDEAERAIASFRPFTNSTGSMRGTRGSTRDLGWLSSHREHVRIKELLSRADYVVWSYDTPIGFVTEDEDGNITKFYVDENHSPTTSQHQGILRCGFGDFEAIGEGPWSRSQRPRTRRTTLPRLRAQEPRPAFEAPRPSREQMLDPRYGNPDWTPWLSGGSNLPPGADQRDHERVQATGGTWVR